MCHNILTTNDKTKLDKVIFRYELYHYQTKYMHTRQVLNSMLITKRNKKYANEKRQSSRLDFNPLLREGVRRLM